MAIPQPQNKHFNHYTIVTSCRIKLRDRRLNSFLKYIFYDIVHINYHQISMRKLCCFRFNIHFCLLFQSEQKLNHVMPWRFRPVCKRRIEWTGHFGYLYHIVFNTRAQNCEASRQNNINFQLLERYEIDGKSARYSPLSLIIYKYVFLKI